MNDEQSRQVCQLIAGIVVSDDDLDPKEEAFVDRLLARFDIPDSEREVIFPIIDSDEARDSMKSLPADVQEEAFALLIEAAAADGSIVPEELTYLEAVAEVVGVTKDALSDRLAEALKKTS